MGSRKLDKYHILKNFRKNLKQNLLGESIPSLLAKYIFIIKSSILVVVVNKLIKYIFIIKSSILVVVVNKLIK